MLLSEAVRGELAAAIERLRPLARGVAWVAPENLHLTLKFLGHVDDALIPALVSSLTAAGSGVPGFVAAVSGLGAFPSVTRPRVIWAGVGEGAGSLVALAAAVEAALAPHGFPPESRPFSPHVTLGRVRVPRQDERLATALGAGAAHAAGRVRVERVSLMRSDLSPRGARYTELAACPLG